MTILIVDDEILALRRLKRLLNELGYTKIFSFSDSKEALMKIEQEALSFDIAFLDIAMPEITGLQLANTILQKSAQTFIIFQTAYDEYALEAFQSGGTDYILKPITKEQIQQALQKVQKHQLNSSTVGSTPKKILGKRGQKIYLIDIDDIFYIKADLDEVIVRLEHVDVYVKKKIGELDLWLKDKHFFRIHRSIIVNVDKIDSMTSIEQSKLHISFHTIDDRVTSSKDGAKEFREYLEKNILS